MERFIAHRCHNGSIICMATNGRYLATGGGDDRIVVLDLKLNRDVHVSIFRNYFADAERRTVMFIIVVVNAEPTDSSFQNRFCNFH